MSVLVTDSRKSGAFWASSFALAVLLGIGSGAAEPLVVADSSAALVTETEKPEDYQKIAAESAYPPADSPEKLTAEQIDAIAKLAPKANKAGLQTHPAMVPLFRSMVFRYTGGTYKNAPLRFRLHVPESLQKDKKYPMVVWLHGAGECGDDNLDQLSHLHHILPYLVGPKKRDFFLLVPQCPHAHVSWEAPEVCLTTVRPDGRVECHVSNDPVELGNAPISFTIAMTEAVLKEFPVDPNRVTLAGLSTGGDGTWRMLERRPDLFAAAVPLVSWRAMQEKSLREKPLLKKIPIWAIYSSDDNAIDFARKEFERMRERGCNVSKTEFGVCGHRAWTPAMLQGDIFGWLISRAKDGERYYAAEASPTDPAKIGIFADVTEGDLAKRQPTKAVRRPVVAVEKQPAPPLPEQRAIVAVEPRRTAGSERGRIATGRSIDVPLPPAPPPKSDWSSAGRPNVEAIDHCRWQLIDRYFSAGDIKKALAVADKVKNRQELVKVLLDIDASKVKNRQDRSGLLMQVDPQRMAQRVLEEFSYSDRELVLDYIDRELDRMEQGIQATARRSIMVDGRIIIVEGPVLSPQSPSPSADDAPLRPIPADKTSDGKKSPKDECGKEWAMTTTTLYGMYPNGWDQEAARVPGYVVNETGAQLRDRLARAFVKDDLAAMRELCDSFIRLDDIPLSSPWFDTSGGRLRGRIQYTLNDKAKPVVELLRDIAGVHAESKKEFAELARKSLERIDAITHPKAEK